MSELEERFLRATMLVDTVCSHCSKMHQKVYDMRADYTDVEKRTLVAALDVQLRNTIQDIDTIIASHARTAKSVPPDYVRSYRFVLAQFHEQRERISTMQLRIAALQAQLPPPPSAASLVAAVSIHVFRSKLEKEK